MKTLSDAISILVVEDNPADLFLIGELLNASGLRIRKIHTAGRSSEACHILKSEEINLILLDLSLPDSFGIETFLNIKEVAKKTPVIILTGFADSDTALDTLKHGAQDYLVKGEIDIPLLVKSVEYSIERKKAEEQLLASEEKYRQVFYKNPLPAFIYDPDTFQILEANDATIEKYGYTRDEILQLTLKDIRPQEDIPQLLASVSYRDNPDLLKGRLWRHKKKNGEVILVEVAFYEINYLGKRAIQSQINDITEKIRLQNELKEQQEIKQKQITEAVLKAQEKERKGIGAELHDNINQILAATRIFLGESLLHEDKREELIRLGLENLGLAIEEIRKLSKTLIIPGFIKLGLKNSVDDLVRHILKAKQLTINLEMDDLDEAVLTEPMKINIYRIIQEQLNNILKYAEASFITIRLQTVQKTDFILLSISDNGKGFDPDQSTGGVGITNINSRAELFNGRVEIDSAPGKGYRLNVYLCLKPASSRQVAQPVYDL